MMMDLETMQWAEQNPKEFREWRDMQKDFWFVVRHSVTGKSKKVKCSGRDIKNALENCLSSLNLSDDWEII